MITCSLLAWLAFTLGETTIGWVSVAAAGVLSAIAFLKIGFEMGKK